jgi:hypothetical protein
MPSRRVTCLSLGQRRAGTFPILCFSDCILEFRMACFPAFSFDTTPEFLQTFRLEEQQRAEKRTREAKGEQFTPRWFNLTDVVSPTPWGDLEIYEYNGKYTEHRAAIDGSDVTDETNVTSVKFSPWQYGRSSSQ